MFPNHRPPQDSLRYRTRRCAPQAQIVPEHPAFPVTAAELARMHPLLRAVIGAVTCEAVETTTVYDGDGDIVSVKTKRTRQPYSARTLQGLLSATRRLIELEQERAGKRPAYDRDGRISDPPVHHPS